jgi:predicted O-linked N-acetylglucosamine transferase (SPINDLY family)
MALRFLGFFSPKSSVKSMPTQAPEILVRARSLQREGQLEPAAAAYASLLELDPDHWESLSAIAAIALQRGELEKAVQLYDIVIARKGDDSEAHYKRANALNGLGRWDAAVAGYDRSVELNPEHANAFCNRGAALERLGRWDKALASYDTAIALNPDDALAYYNRGSVLKELKRLDEALASYEHAIALKPDYAEAYINRGNLLRESGRDEAAVASYDTAIELNSGYFQAFHGRGLSLGRCGRLAEALASHERAIALKGDYAEAHIGRGNMLQKLKQHEAAIESYGRAIELEPFHPEAFEGCAFSLFSIGQIEAAIRCYNRVLVLDPNRKYVRGMRRHAQMHICDWDDFAPDMERLAEGLMSRLPVVEPFPLSALVDSPLLHRLAAEIWVRGEFPPDDALGRLPERLPGDKIRVGYFSADFRAHPVSLLTAELFETHDRSRFEITAFAFGPEANDAVRERLRRAFDRFIDVRDHSDIEVASLARKLGIDIAVDLGGFTVHSRTKIFALRAAPVQIGYIGYLGTMGAPYMDYVVADESIIPADRRQDYAEKIIYLPSYQVNDSQRRISERTFTREELGLPPAGFVFSCFNASYKMTPSTFEVWMRILRRVDGSILFLYADNQVARRNLASQAERHGVDASRLVFGERIPVEHYLARLRSMDIFLDTLPYNGGTTASDALWAGLPVLTCLGQAFASRYAASLLRAIGLPELIAASPAQYEEMAVSLASDPAQLSLIRGKLARNRLTAPLFDTARFTRSLEYAYTQVYERACANLPPEHVFPQSGRDIEAATNAE